MKTLSRSDIIMTRPGSIEEYQRFPATMLGWGLLPEQIDVDCHHLKSV